MAVLMTSSMCGKLTNGGFFVLRSVVKVMGVDVGHVSQLLGLIFVDVKRLFVQGMLYGVCPKLVICVQCMEVFQSLSKAPKMVVNLELFSKFRKLL